MKRRVCRARLGALLLPLVTLSSVASCPRVVPADDGRELVFVTTGSCFSPLVVVDGCAEVLWTFSDGATSDSASPSIDFGTEARRDQRLRVTPWTALKAVDLGYEGSDGGILDLSLYGRLGQPVQEVQNLDLVASSLEVWCSSCSGIESLDFTGFTSLNTIECYRATRLKSVRLDDCPNLRRVCFEDCDLENLDLTGCPGLEDLRAAMNSFPVVLFADSMPWLWHLCIQGNPQMTVEDLFASTERFPRLRDLYIWDTNQAGALRVSSTPAEWIGILASNNNYTSVDLSGALQAEMLGANITLQDNQLTSINIDGCDQISYLDLSNNLLGEDAVRYVLGTLDTLGRWNGDVDLAGTGNAIAPPDAQSAIDSLTAKGWTVEVNK